MMTLLFLWMKMKKDFLPSTLQVRIYLVGVGKGFPIPTVFLKEMLWSSIDSALGILGNTLYVLKS
ncbi:hypothetical protein MTR67_002670 [Solanum verrucosum]|uniref:Uncharacterized protein n=1 Tax=Solanum verrucosum TaxID=315347 RepID=A0AAF0PU29_SOLVR|nr:hypothetical protein MTR67_002670 [Solanum verrucosum]